MREKKAGWEGRDKEVGRRVGGGGGRHARAGGEIDERGGDGEGRRVRR